MTFEERADAARESARMLDPFDSRRVSALFLLSDAEGSHKAALRKLDAAEQAVAEAPDAQTPVVNP